MAKEEKYTESAIVHLLRHNMRQTVENSNPDIDPERTPLNYGYDLDHGGLSDYQYYRKLVDSAYLYGRGTEAEKKAITSVGWVITCPKEIVGDPEKEKVFFRAVFDFVSHRYGQENIINVQIHYDENAEFGEPHIHILFCPITQLDHDLVKYKTRATKQAVKLPSGRYEYKKEFVLDSDGNRIPLKNYSRLTDYYDTKISGRDVMNKAELRHFHTDLQAYLDQNGIEGRVITGGTGGISLSVKSMKEFTKTTGITIDDLKTTPLGPDDLKMLLDSTTLKTADRAKIEAINDRALVEVQRALLIEREAEIERLNASISATKTDVDVSAYERQIEELKTELEQAHSAENEINRLNAKINSLEAKLEARDQEIERLKSDRSDVTQDTVQEKESWQKISREKERTDIESTITI